MKATQELLPPSQARRPIVGKAISKPALHIETILEYIVSKSKVGKLTQVVRGGPGSVLNMGVFGEIGEFEEDAPRFV